MKIKVGPFEYEVFRVCNLKGDDGTPLDGHLIHSQSQILLEENMDPQATLQTLVHEIVHEVVIQKGLKVDESTVDALAFGWIEVMRANPALVDIICQKPKAKKKAKVTHDPHYD